MHGSLGEHSLVKRTPWLNKVVVHLDDGFDIEDSFERAESVSIKGDLCASGFVINERKGNWIPV